MIFKKISSVLAILTLAGGLALPAGAADIPDEQLVTPRPPVENTGGYEGSDAVWNAEYDASEDIEYELLGDATQVPAEVFADPNSTVELYRENDFLQ